MKLKLKLPENPYISRIHFYKKEMKNKFGFDSESYTLKGALSILDNLETDFLKIKNFYK